MIDYQAVLDATVSHYLDGADCESMPEWRNAGTSWDAVTRTGTLFCPSHGALLAEFDERFEITAESECVECEILTCNDCSTFHQHLCSKHREQVAS